MLHFNQRGWFRMFPEDSASGASSETITPTPGEIIQRDPVKNSTIPIPSTAKEYYLAKIASLVGEDAPIERQLSKAVIPIVKKASVEFAPVDPEEYPDAPEGALIALYTFSEEENTILEFVNSYKKPESYFVRLALVDGVTSALLEKSDPSFPNDGFEYRPSEQGLELFTGMSSSGTKVIDFFVEMEVEPQPKTREEYYLAKKANLFIANMSWKYGDVILSKHETELALDELDPDDSGLNRWPHGTASFIGRMTTTTNKIIVNGDQEAAYLVDDDGPIPESGYAFKKNIVRDNNVIRADIIIWHIGSTDVTEAINFICLNHAFIEDIPQPKTRSEVYVCPPLGPDESIPEPLTRKEVYKSLIGGYGLGEDFDIPEPKIAIEFYLAKIAGVYDGELPDPKTPTEFYLAIQAGWEPTSD